MPGKDIVVCSNDRAGAPPNPGPIGRLLREVDVDPPPYERAQASIDRASACTKDDATKDDVTRYDDTLEHVDISNMMYILCPGYAPTTDV